MCMNFQQNLKDYVLACVTVLLMNSVSSGFWPPNDFYHAVCNIHSVLRGIQDYGAVFYCGLFKYY